MPHTLYSAIILVLGLSLTLDRLYSDEDCVTSGDVAKTSETSGGNKKDNGSPLTGDGGPAGVMTLYVTGFAAAATCYDIDLDCIGEVEGPAPTGTGDYSGYCAHTDDGGVTTETWYDATDCTLYEVVAGVVTSAVPVPGLGVVQGMCYHPEADTLWFCRVDQREYVEVTREGTLTGRCFPNPSGPDAFGSGIAYRHDLGTLMIAHGLLADGEITTLSPIDELGETTGVAIDVSELDLTSIGFVWVNEGSNGTPSIFITDTVANLNIEIDAPIEGDCNGNGLNDPCEIEADPALDCDGNGILDECEMPVPVCFVRGDVNGSDSVDIADAIGLLSQLFVPGFTLADCGDAQDANDDGGVDISDPISILSALFTMGPLPPAPYPACGTDPTPDALDCVESPCS